MLSLVANLSVRHSMQHFVRTYANIANFNYHHERHTTNRHHHRRRAVLLYAPHNGGPM